jgi:hypothetical protein
MSRCISFERDEAGANLGIEDTGTTNNKGKDKYGILRSAQNGEYVLPPQQ